MKSLSDQRVLVTRMCARTCRRRKLTAECGSAEKDQGGPFRSVDAGSGLSIGSGLQSEESRATPLEERVALHGRPSAARSTNCGNMLRVVVVVPRVLRATTTLWWRTRFEFGGLVDVTWFAREGTCFSASPSHGETSGWGSQ